MAMAAMATHSMLQSLPLLSPIPKPKFSQVSLHGVSLNLPRQSLPLSLTSVAPIPKKRVPVLAVIKGTSDVEGVFALTEEVDGPTLMNVRVSGLAPGPHGFHLHEYGDTTNGCISTETTIADDQIPLSCPDDVFGSAFIVDELEDDLGIVAAVPKKRTSRSKKRIRKNVWKRKASVAALKALSLAKSLYSGRSKSFMSDKKE